MRANCYQSIAAMGMEHMEVLIYPREGDYCFLGGLATYLMEIPLCRLPV